MSTIDTVTKEFISDNEVFADVVNFMIFDGQKVITLVINFSPDKWDAPVSLYEMIDFKSDVLKKFVPDYRINVIEPAAFTKEQLKKFTTGFREVMECIKYSEDM